MQNLIEFLIRNGVFLVFVGLEILCFNLVIHNNSNQAQIYHNTSARLTGAMQKQVSSLADFWDLRAVNDSLRTENAVLRTQLINRIAAGTSSKSPTDSTLQRYGVIPAMVIQNSIRSRNNYITLDRGAVDGVQRGMGVVSASGPVGIVVATSENFAKVISMLHSNSMISAAVRSRGYFGSLIWRSANPKIMELDAIPKHARLTIGDTVETSGYSSVFPPELNIGTIDTFWLPRGSNFYRARVRLDVDLSKLHTVYVIENKKAKELEELDEATIDE